MILWNVACGEAVVRIDTVHTDLIYSACWNRDGSRILTSCKDKTMRVLDPRNGTVLIVGFLLGPSFPVNAALPPTSLQLYQTSLTLYCSANIWLFS